MCERVFVPLVSQPSRDFLLKPELLRAISDLGFEHPSEGMFSGVVISAPVLKLPCF